MAEDREKLIQALTEELSAWRALRQRAAALPERRNKVLAGCSQLQQRAKNAAEAAMQEVAATVATLKGAVDGLGAGIEQLTFLPNALQQAARQAREEIPEVLARMSAAGGEAAGILDEQMEHFANDLAERLENAGRSITEVLTEDFTDVISETYANGVELVCETYETLRTETTENVAQLAEHARQEVREFEGQLAEIRDGCRQSVTSLKNDLEEVTGSIEHLGADVSELMETVEAAMQTTGTGMNMATSSMNDIKSAMEEIV